jgi:hypothetical protein
MRISRTLTRYFLGTIGFLMASAMMGLFLAIQQLVS